MNTERFNMMTIEERANKLKEVLKIKTKGKMSEEDIGIMISENLNLQHQYVIKVYTNLISFINDTSMYASLFYKNDIVNNVSILVKYKPMPTRSTITSIFSGKPENIRSEICILMRDISGSGDVLINNAKNIKDNISNLIINSEEMRSADMIKAIVLRCMPELKSNQYLTVSRLIEVLKMLSIDDIETLYNNMISIISDEAKFIDVCNLVGSQLTYNGVCTNTRTTSGLILYATSPMKFGRSNTTTVFNENCMLIANTHDWKRAELDDPTEVSIVLITTTTVDRDSTEIATNIYVYLPEINISLACKYSKIKLY